MRETQKQSTVTTYDKCYDMEYILVQWGHIHLFLTWRIGRSENALTEDVTSSMSLFISSNIKKTMLYILFLFIDETEVTKRRSNLYKAI